jgi:hypothetical protein
MLWRDDQPRWHPAGFHPTLSANGGPAPAVRSQQFQARRSLRLSTLTSRYWLAMRSQRPRKHDTFVAPFQRFIIFGLSMFGQSISPFLIRAATVIGRLPKYGSFICFDSPWGAASLESWIRVVNHASWFGSDRTAEIPSDFGPEDFRRLELVIEDFRRALGRPPNRVGERFAFAVLLEPNSLLRLSDVSLDHVQVVSVDKAVAWDSDRPYRGPSRPRYDPRIGKFDYYSFKFSWGAGVLQPRR